MREHRILGEKDRGSELLAMCRRQVFRNSIPIPKKGLVVGVSCSGSKRRRVERDTFIMCPQLCGAADYFSLKEESASSPRNLLLCFVGEESL